MKRILMFFLPTFFMCSIAWSQSVPQGMKYQAVARDLKGNILANQPIELKIALISDVERQTIAYSETHSVTTNEVGLFTLVIGEGGNQKGLFEDVPWSTHDIWMEVSIKDKDATDFAMISNSRLLAVPYAFHAGTANEIVGPIGRGTGGVPANVWTLFGNSNTDDTKDRLGTTDCADLVMITNNVERLRITCEGDIDIAQSLTIGDDLDVGHDLHVGNDGAIDQDVFLNVDGGNTIVNGDLTVANQSSTLLTGTLDVDGETDLHDNLNVDGTTTLHDDLTVADMAPTHLTGTLEVDKATDLNLTLNVDGTTTLNDDLTVTGMAPTHLTGNLTVDKNVNIGGTLTTAGVATINDMLNVEANTSYVAKFTNTTDANGICIQVNKGIPAMANDFITFKNDHEITVGRIEGQTFDELHQDFDWLFFQVMSGLHEAFQIALVAADIADGEPFIAGVDGAELVACTAEWIIRTVQMQIEIGVAYQSGSGDYAEWLEKEVPNEVFSYGDIVGVNGGKISKEMPDADQYMVVSLSPILLGNMPPEEEEELYEKVAFMGQVPVKVRGVVNIGDYIIASVLGDGFGRAVSPLEITVDQFQRIVGVAWSAADGKKVYSMINVAVGINTKHSNDKLKQLQGEVDELKLGFNRVTSYLQTKDPDFNVALLAVSAEKAAKNEVATPDTKEGFTSNSYNNNLALVANYLEKNPEVLKNVLANTKEILDSKGVDYNRFEQTRRLVTDEKYLINFLNESSQN